MGFAALALDLISVTKSAGPSIRTSGGFQIRADKRPVTRYGDLYRKRHSITQHPHLLAAREFCSTIGMTENGEVVGRKRRGSQEVQRLVTEFESSGLRQREFCRKQGLALSTLRRQLKRRKLGKCETNHSGPLVRVKLARRNRGLKSPARSGLEVVLSNGRRIEV